MIFTIFKKELKDTLRDRRTLVMMLLIPIMIFPIILYLFMSISAAFTEDAMDKKVRIAVVAPSENYFLKQLEMLPAELGKKEVHAAKDTLSLIEDIRKDSVQIGIYIPANFDQLMAQKQPAEVKIYFNATEIGMQDRAKRYVEAIENIAQQERYLDLKLNATELTPIMTQYENVASDEEMLGMLAGGMLPYIFIAFGFLGCMYPAIDLFTGEKERGTIETLLTTPVARWQILFGKMGVVVLSGLMASFAALFGLFLSIEVLDIVENEELLELIHGVLTPGFVLMLFGLLFPLTVFFAGVMVPISINTRSFKEAQSIITPLNIIMVLPAMVGFFPGVELNTATACIPVVNVVLATKELIAGTLEPGLLALSFGVMVLFALSAIFVSYKRFDKESNVVL